MTFVTQAVSALYRFSGRVNGGTPESGLYAGTDRGAQAGAGIPARAGIEGPVGAGGDVVEGRAFLCGVERGIEEAAGFALRGVDDGDQAGPERSYSAGAADDSIFAVDAHAVAGGGVGISGDVGETATAAADGGCGYFGVCLPGGQWKDVRNAAPGGAFVVGELIPNDFAGDLCVDAGPGTDELCAATGEDVGAGGGEVDVVGAVRDAVGGAGVAAGHGDGDAERGGGLAGLVHGGDGLRRPGGFGAAPADGDDAGLAGGVMDGGRDGVGEALIGVGSKVDRDGGAGGDGCGYFYVEKDLTIGTVGAGRLVFCLVDRDGIDRGGILAQRAEVDFKIGLLEAAAEFDQADGLAGTARGGKVVQRGYLDRCVGDVRGARDGEAIVRGRLRAIVQAEDGYEVGCEFFGHGERALADAEVAVGGFGFAERGSEGFFHGLDGAGELHGTARFVDFGFNLEVEGVGELLNRFDGDRVGTVALGELLVGEYLGAETGSIERSFAFHEHGDRKMATLWQNLGGLGFDANERQAGVAYGVEGLAFASWQGNPGLFGVGDAGHGVEASGTL